MPPSGIRHLYVSTVPDDQVASEIQPSNWNDRHVLDVLEFGAMSAPSGPAEGNVWVEATGISPNRTIALKVRDNGVSRTIASITY